MAIDKKNKDSEHIALPKDGAVSAISQPSQVTEKEIFNDRQAIINKLQNAYVELAKNMKPYQQAWDSSRVLAMEDALWTGIKAGATDWGHDNADLFKKETWTAIGQGISHAAGTAYDAASQYAAMQQKKIVKSVNEALYGAEELAKHPAHTLATWALHIYEDDVVKPMHDIKQYALEKEHQLSTAAQTAQKMYQHKDAIFELPKQMARGDVKGIQAFIDGPLVEIDPELAKEIKGNPNLPIVLEIIADHDTALAFCTYAGLFYEAVPPNFYAFIASKGGVYLLIEVILTIALAIFTEGVGAAARIASLVARIGSAAAKVAKVSEKLAQFEKAAESFKKMLIAFETATNDLLLLGKKLSKARSKGFVAKGATKEELKVTRKIEERKHHCMICGSTAHDTPHGHGGTIQYV